MTMRVRMAVITALAIGLAVCLGPAAAAADAAPWAAAAGPVGTDTTVAGIEIPQGPLTEVEELLRNLQRELGVDLPKLGVRDVIGMIRGTGDGPNLRALGSALAAYFAREVVVNLHLLGRLVALMALLGVLTALRTSFGSESVARAAYLVTAVVLAGLAISGLRTGVEATRGHIQLTVDFMRAILPVLLSLLIGVGAVVTAGLFSPWMLFATYFIASVSSGVVVPLVIVAAACEIVSTLGGEIKVTAAASVCRQIAITVLGVSMTVFLGVMTVQSAAGSVADGVAMRTGKFLATSFIPIIGKMFGDAFEMVIGGSLVLKNAVGIAGAIAVFVITALPALKVGALVLIYRIAAALAEPIAGPQIVACLDGIANCLGLMLLAVCGTGLAWFVSIVMIMGAGNAAVMMR
ncbi:MAG: stage III sporulation protein AE [Bacillota bacterium]|nr:stage III sporulation protein AE [Bacillota bacterium]